MDWFEALTGFRERSYAETRAKLKVEGSRLHSVVNGKNYGIGDLELVPLQTLRERVKSAAGPRGRLKVSIARGDVRKMHHSPENAGALFQVASQFNLLEMVGPSVTPEDGITRYKERPHPGSGVRNCRRRSHDLPQLFRPGRWQPWSDGGASARRIGRCRCQPERRLESAH